MADRSPVRVRRDELRHPGVRLLAIGGGRVQVPEEPLGRRRLGHQLQIVEVDLEIGAAVPPEEKVVSCEQVLHGECPRDAQAHGLLLDRGDDGLGPRQTPMELEHDGTRLRAPRLPEALEVVVRPYDEGVNASVRQCALDQLVEIGGDDVLHEPGCDESRDELVVPIRFVVVHRPKRLEIVGVDATDLGGDELGCQGSAACAEELLVGELGHHVDQRRVRRRDRFDGLVAKRAPVRKCGGWVHAHSRPAEEDEVVRTQPTEKPVRGRRVVDVVRAVGHVTR